MRVKWDDLEHAFLYIGSGEPYQNHAVVCRETGEFLWHSEYGDNFDEWPDDVDDEEKYLAIPDKRQLDLGKPLVLAFARSFLADDYDDVRRMFSRSGAYARFKDLLVRRRALERWYEFENEATRRALKEWAEENDVEIDWQGHPPGDAVE